MDPDSQPKPEWTLERALDCLRQGYTMDRVVELSGHSEECLKIYLKIQLRQSTYWGRTDGW